MVRFVGVNVCGEEIRRTSARNIKYIKHYYYLLFIKVASSYSEDSKKYRFKMESFAENQQINKYYCKFVFSNALPCLLTQIQQF